LARIKMFPASNKLVHTKRMEFIESISDHVVYINLIIVPCAYIYITWMELNTLSVARNTCSQQQKI